MTRMVRVLSVDGRRVLESGSWFGSNDIAREAAQAKQCAGY